MSDNATPSMSWADMVEEDLELAPLPPTSKSMTADPAAAAAGNGVSQWHTYAEAAKEEFENEEVVESAKEPEKPAKTGLSASRWANAPPTSSSSSPSSPRRDHSSYSQRSPYQSRSSNTDGTWRRDIPRRDTPFRWTHDLHDNQRRDTRRYDDDRPRQGRGWETTNQNDAPKRHEFDGRDGYERHRQQQRPTRYHPDGTAVDLENQRWRKNTEFEQVERVTTARTEEPSSPIRTSQSLFGTSSGSRASKWATPASDVAKPLPPSPHDSQNDATPPPPPKGDSGWGDAPRDAPVDASNWAQAASNVSEPAKAPPVEKEDTNDASTASGWGDAPPSNGHDASGWGASNENPAVSDEPVTNVPEEQEPVRSASEAGWGAPPPRSSNNGWGETAKTDETAVSSWGKPLPRGNGPDSASTELPPEPQPTAVDQGWGAPPKNDEMVTSGWGKPVPRANDHEPASTETPPEQEPVRSASEAGWGAPPPRDSNNGWGEVAKTDETNKLAASRWGQPVPRNDKDAAPARPVEEEAAATGWGKPLPRETPSDASNWGALAASTVVPEKLPEPSPSNVQQQSSGWGKAPSDAPNWGQQDASLQNVEETQTTKEEPQLENKEQPSAGWGDAPRSAASDASNWGTPAPRKPEQPMPSYTIQTKVEEQGWGKPPIDAANWGQQPASHQKIEETQPAQEKQRENEASLGWGDAPHVESSGAANWGAPAPTKRTTTTTTTQTTTTKEPEQGWGNAPEPTSNWSEIDEKSTNDAGWGNGGGDASHGYPSGGRTTTPTTSTWRDKLKSVDATTANSAWSALQPNAARQRKMSTTSTVSRTASVDHDTTASVTHSISLSLANEPNRITPNITLVQGHANQHDESTPAPAADATANPWIKYSVNHTKPGVAPAMRRASNASQPTTISNTSPSLNTDATDAWATDQVNMNNQW